MVSGFPSGLERRISRPDSLPSFLLTNSSPCRGIANSVSESGDASELHKVAADVKEGRRADLSDPGMLEAIMGKSDATLMKEAMSAAVDDRLDEDQRG